MTFQIVKAAEALGSVFKICEAGHRAIFDSEGSHIEDNNSDEVTWLEERNGLFVLPASYAPPGWKPGDPGLPPSGFAGLGR